MVYSDEQRNRLSVLLSGYVQDTLTPAELRELRAWMSESKRNEALAKRLKDTGNMEEAYHFLASLDTEKAWQSLLDRTQAHPKPLPSKSHFLRYAAAAAVALLFGVFYFFPSNRYSGSDKGSNLAPSSNNKTTLSLQDGKQVILDELKEGINEIEAGVFVTKSQGRIVYGSNTLNSTIHTLSTPVGATYQLVLPDQTTVWLNAESSLSFPVTFSREERLVKFSGEGYFEVSHTDPLADTPGKRPFKVETATTTVEVLGTEFNLSAYPNEPSATTLIEGKVKVQGSRSSVTLRPGQQAIASDKLNVAEVDTEELLAWREGFFQFDNRPLAFILPQLQRWYGFELAPNTTLPTKHFTASISRSQSLPTVLKMLEISGDVKFSLTNNYLSVNQLNNN